MNTKIIIATLGTSALLASTSISQAQDLNVNWKGAPEFSSADGNYKIKLRGRILADWGTVSDNNGKVVDATEFRAARLGVEGVVMKDIKYKFEIDMPPKTIPKVSRVVGNLVEDETIFYKFGLMANYPNIFSNIMNARNISTFYPLNEGFDYQEIKELIKLGREFRSRLEDSQKTEAIVNDPNVDLDFKYQQISDMLGDYPNNLFIEDSTLDKEVQQSLSKGIIDVKVV